MPSATLADSRLSTAPRRVKESAAGNTSSTDEVENDGNRGGGTPSGSWPKWLPIVSTGKWNSHATKEARTTAINIPATVGANTAYAGFTAGTAGYTANQSILNWTYAVN